MHIHIKKKESRRLNSLIRIKKVKIIELLADTLLIKLVNFIFLCFCFINHPI